MLASNGLLRRSPRQFRFPGFRHFPLHPWQRRLPWTPLRDTFPKDPGARTGGVHPSSSAARRCFGGTSTPNDGRLSPSDCVLGLEFTCDDTGVAVVSGRGEILSQALSSELRMQHETGGVVPTLAALAHEHNFPLLLPKVFQEFHEIQSEGSRSVSGKAGKDGYRLRGIAFSAGPGLSLCLSVGLKEALRLSRELKLPLIPVNHLEAHALVSSLPCPKKEHPTDGEGLMMVDGYRELRYPHLCLLVSGGHTEIWIAEAYGEYRVLGKTLDDAIGEAFDKTAQILRLQELGWKDPQEAWGASLSRLAALHDALLKQSRGGKIPGREGQEDSVIGQETNGETVFFSFVDHPSFVSVNRSIIFFFHSEAFLLFLFRYRWFVYFPQI